MPDHALSKLHNFLLQGKTLRYKKREMILRADDTPSGVYLLTKGYVRCYSISQNGQDFTLIIFKPNDFFPMAWIVGDMPNIYYFEAMTPVVVQRVIKGKLINFLRENPDILILLTRGLVERMHGLFRRMEELVFGTASNKVASILLLCAQRFGIKDGKTIIILLPLTHWDLASLLGLARETVSIEIERLKKMSIVTYRGKQIVILSVKKLQRATQA